MKRFIIIIALTFILFNYVDAQCVSHQSKYPEIKQVFEKLTHDNSKPCNFQFNIGFPPDVNFNIETISSCLSKKEVVNLVTIYLGNCGQKDSTSTLFKQLELLLDEVDYQIRLIKGTSKKEEPSFLSFIYNERTWIFMGDHLYLD